MLDKAIISLMQLRCRLKLGGSDEIKKLHDVETREILNNNTDVNRLA